MKRLLPFLTFIVVAATASAAEPRFKVEVKGKGSPLLLIPGLASPGSVYDGVAAKLQDRFELHILTLPGFAGVPSIPDPMLATVRDEIIAYVKDKKLQKPGIIGHSLGGVLALWTASTAPELFGRIVAIDSLPALGNMLPGATAEDKKKSAAGTRDRLLSTTPEEYAMSAEGSLAMMITNRETAKTLSLQTRKSDPKAVGRAMYEMLTNDLTGEVAKIQSPILVLIGGGLATTKAASEAIQKGFKDQYAGVKDVKFVYFPKARHFIFLDDPQGFQKAVDEFLK